MIRINNDDLMQIISEEFEIKLSTLYDTKKTRDRICQYARNLEKPKNVKNPMKRLKLSKHEDLEEAVYKWYKQERSVGIVVHGTDI